MSWFDRIFRNGLSVQFTSAEKRNVIMYIAGIMAFKFAFETLGTSIGLLAQDRFSKTDAVTFLAILTSVFNICQCICSIAVAQLICYWSTNVLLAVSIWSFGGLALVLIIMEAATGGTLSVHGTWNVYILFPVYMLMGGCLGIIELIRRIIPRDILGEDAVKLKKMDAIVHIFYEVAGTAGAFFSAYYIDVMSPVYALSLLPFFFTIAGFLWWQIRRDTMTGLIEDERKAKILEDKIKVDQKVINSTSSIEGSTTLNSNVGHSRQSSFLVALKSIGEFFKVYFQSIVTGGRIIFGHRKFAWLLFGYTLPLVLHRFIENILFPTFAKTILGQGSLSGILLGGSNFGELLGALGVLLFSLTIATPLPWVRFDAVALSVLWIFPFAKTLLSDSFGSLQFALACIPLMLVLSGGWAAGDVSLVAFIQSELNNTVMPAQKGERVKTSALGSVMAFLYSSYIIIFTIVSPLAGRVFDAYKAKGMIEWAFFWIAGIGIAVVCASIIFASTFIPKNSCALNPKMEHQLEPDEENLAMNEVTSGSGDDMMELVFSG